MAREALALDRVLLVVANVPWQKAGTRAVTPAEDRFRVVQAAVAGVAGLEASRMEIDRGGASYTADTVAELLGSVPAVAPYLIVGADVAAELETWQRVDELRESVTLVVVDRGGVGAAQDPPGWQRRAAAHPGARHLEQPAPGPPGRGPLGRFPHPRGRHTLHPPAESVRWHQMKSPDAVRTAVRPTAGAPGGLTEVDVAVPAA